MPSAASLAVLLTCLVLGACGQPAPTRAADPVRAAGQPVSMSFDEAAIGNPPAGFRCAWPGPAGVKPARWEVIADATAPHPGQVLQQSDGDATNHRYPVALWEGARFADVRVAVHARAISGGRDRSFGVVARAGDERNYYVLRANTSDWGENVRLYRFVDGQRTQLAEWEGPVARDAWHELALEAVGDRLVGMLDGRVVIEQRDATFAGPGLAGVWTKAESVSRFDDLTITAVTP